MKSLEDMEPEAVGKYMPGLKVEIGVCTDGKSIKGNCNVLEQISVHTTKECWGVYSHDLNNGKG